MSWGNKTKPIEQYEALFNAYLAVAEDGMTVRKAASLYKVPFTTLHDRVNGRVAIDNFRKGPPPLFCPEEEIAIIKFLKWMTDLGYCFIRREVLDLVSDFGSYLNYLPEGRKLSIGWLTRFYKRWRDSMKKNPVVTSRFMYKETASNEDNFSSYFNNLKTCLAKHDLLSKPEYIFNIDVQSLSQTETIDRTVENTKVFCAGNAAGDLIPPYFAVPSTEDIDEVMKNKTEGASGTYTGSSRYSVLRTYFKDHFVPGLNRPSLDQPILTVVDGTRMFINIDVIDYLRNINIHVFILPANTPTILQPIQNGCFKTFEEYFESLRHELLQKSHYSEAITLTDVCELACESYSLGFQPSLLKNAFKETGIYPFQGLEGVDQLSTYLLEEPKLEQEDVLLENSCCCFCCIIEQDVGTDKTQISHDSVGSFMKLSDHAIFKTQSLQVTQDIASEMEAQLKTFNNLATLEIKDHMNGHIVWLRDENGKQKDWEALAQLYMDMLPEDVQRKVNMVALGLKVKNLVQWALPHSMQRMRTHGASKESKEVLISFLGSPFKLPLKTLDQMFIKDRSYDRRTMSALRQAGCVDLVVGGGAPEEPSITNNMFFEVSSLVESLLDGFDLSDLDPHNLKVGHVIKVHTVKGLTDRWGEVALELMDAFPKVTDHNLLIEKIHKSRLKSMIKTCVSKSLAQLLNKMNSQDEIKSSTEEITSFLEEPFPLPLREQYIKAEIKTEPKPIGRPRKTLSDGSLKKNHKPRVTPKEENVEIVVDDNPSGAPPKEVITALDKLLDHVVTSGWSKDDLESIKGHRLSEVKMEPDVDKGYKTFYNLYDKINTQPDNAPLKSRLRQRKRKSYKFDSYEEQYKDSFDDRDVEYVSKKRRSAVICLEKVICNPETDTFKLDLET